MRCWLIFGVALQVVTVVICAPEFFNIKDPWYQAYIKDSTVQNDDVGQIRIVGGQEAPVNSIPYQAGLIIQRTDGEQALCGGSLISDRFVVTAAHCVENLQSVTVYLGAHVLRIPEHGRIERRVGRDNIIVHEGWNLDKIINDIALINLSAPVKFNDKVSPINLPRRSDVSRSFVGDQALASGWGMYTDMIQAVSQHLREVNLTIIGQADCQRSFGSFIRSGNICTSGANGKSTCVGDSGGPLAVYDRSGTKTLVGLTSFGGPYCQLGMPVAFTRITHYLDWIAANTGINISW